MADILCIIMGVMDVLAGILIILGFTNHTLAILFGIVMIGKGGISFME